MNVRFTNGFNFICSRFRMRPYSRGLIQLSDGFRVKADTLMPARA